MVHIDRSGLVYRKRLFFLIIYYFLIFIFIFTISTILPAFNLLCPEGKPSKSIFRLIFGAGWTVLFVNNLWNIILSLFYRFIFNCTLIIFIHIYFSFILFIIYLNIKIQEFFRYYYLMARFKKTILIYYILLWLLFWFFYNFKATWLLNWNLT